jgi:two-component system, NarL family, captular synthesis response regulator RcsB
MYKKVLISEDIDTINLAIQLTLFQLMITDMQHVKYCDDAVLKVKKAINDNEPFDLFITDLSFEKDTRSVKLTSGEQAIAEIRKIQPNIKVIVYSVEDKKHRIKELYSKYNINAYVHKNRNSIEQLKIAITNTFQAETAYISPELQHLLEDKTNLQIDQIDIKILEQLALGLTHEEITTILKQQNIIPSSKSAIEKKVNKLKDYFKANNTIHLIAITKDLGII